MKSSSTSEDLVCLNCGAPLQPNMQKCSYCKTPNPAYVKPVEIEIPQKITPHYTTAAVSKRPFYADSLFDNSGPVAKFFLLMLIPLVISSFVIMAVPDLLSNFYYSAGNIGMSDDLIRLLILNGSLSAYWSVNIFLPSGSNFKIYNFGFGVLMFIAYFVLFTTNVSHKIVNT